MGSGKTTVGKILSRKLGTRFLDTDKIIEGRFKMPVKDIFNRYGEGCFRRAETRVIKELSEKTGGVISLGGGSLDFEENGRVIKSCGRVIFLDVRLSTVLRRLENDTARPMLVGISEEELKSLYEKRKEVYLKNANLIIDANAAPIEVCRRILTAVHTKNF